MAFSFHIQSDSEIPASQQLLDQLQFAIASHQFASDQRLPSLRQLEMITGLHRNTISKIYRELEALGLVKLVPGSGVYVQDQRQSPATPPQAIKEPSPQLQTIFDDAIHQLLEAGYSLPQIRQLFIKAIDWRFACAAQVIITVPQRELGAGQWILQEISQAITIPLQLVPLEALAERLERITAATLVTTPYFVQAVAAIAPPNIQIIPVTLHDYGPELAQIKALPPNHHLGLVSFSPGILHAASTIIQSLKGSDINLIVSTPEDSPRLCYLIQRSETILCDSLSYKIIKKQLEKLYPRLIHQPQIILCKNYISKTSLRLLKQTFETD
ncbi:GntR family transcriptional regulator [Picosynechococcus sp. PCC 11901]|uniref:GntR family transcriptional regulator n=1 Tax=Picosynechococcus sp. PCC 11901 TaxID=2579791 RepID=UPI00143CEF52|nr:GntR family transcriptional regulator [Picosynechococcus sp. PCC 11901]